jgi:hypothetical protein
MLFLACILIITGHHEEPGPLDGYRANYSRIKVDCEFTYSGGQLDRGNFDESRIWLGNGISIIEDRRTYSEGR